MQLDKTCSILFSLSFLFVIILLGVCFIYFLFLILYVGAKLMIPEVAFRTYEKYLLIVIISFFLGISLIGAILNLQYFRNKEKYAKWQFTISWNLSKLMFPYINKTLNYVTLTFYTNNSTKRLMTYGIVFFLFFYILLFNLMLTKQVSDIYDARSFYTNGSDQYEINSNCYDNLREKAEKIQNISIASDIVKGDFLKLFIAYPKSLDEELKKFCKKPHLADTLDKYTKRKIKDVNSLKCFSEYYKITINDSIYKDLDFAFQQHPNAGEKGIVSYIPTKGFKEGKNLITISKSKPDSTDKKGYLYALPFWYSR